jgi:hypothetical protein
LLTGHVAGVTAVLTAVVLTIGVPAGHRVAVSVAGTSHGGLLAAVAPGRDPGSVNQPAGATTDSASSADLIAAGAAAP